jgi:hypothetical protein
MVVIVDKKEMELLLIIREVCFAAIKRLLAATEVLVTREEEQAGGRIKIFVPTCSSSTVNPIYTINGGTGFTNASSGSYQVICGVTNLNEAIKEQYAIKVFPNPFSETVTLTFKYDDTPENMSKINVLNTIGMIIKTISSDDLKYNRTIQIDLSELSSGIYFIKTTINNLSYDYKIIKQ